MTKAKPIQDPLFALNREIIYQLAKYPELKLTDHIETAKSNLLKWGIKLSDYYINTEDK